MELSALAGNGPLKSQLSQRQGSRGLSHAYILSGPAGSGRHTLARLLAGAMVCTAPEEDRPCGRCGPCKKVEAGIHPDVAVISGLEAGKPITVDQVRSLRSDAYIRPNEGRRKVYLLEEADRMNSSAQNAMLKLLEEGPSYAAFLLLAENGGGLLETVRSRCEELALAPVSLREGAQWLAQKYPAQPPEAIHAAVEEAQGILGQAIALLEGDADARQQRMTQARRLAGVVEAGDELALLEALIPLDKLPKEELPLLLNQLRGALVERASGSSNAGRLIQAARLVGSLQGGLAVNANPGQLTGWLCAQLFSQEN